MQLNYYNSFFQKKNFPITVVCDNVTNAPNLGSLFRICDAFGVKELILCGQYIPLGRKMLKTSRASEKVVNYKIQKNCIDAIKDLKNKDHFLIALEITTTSKPLSSYPFPTNLPIAVIVGDENFGISEAILKLCDDIIHIEMYGQNSSMNVVQATNIALYEITKQLI